MGRTVDVALKKRCNNDDKDEPKDKEPGHHHQAATGTHIVGRALATCQHLYDVHEQPDNEEPQHDAGKDSEPEFRFGTFYNPLDQPDAEEHADDRQENLAPGYHFRIGTLE